MRSSLLQTFFVPPPNASQNFENILNSKQFRENIEKMFDAYRKQGYRYGKYLFDALSLNIDNHYNDDVSHLISQLDFTFEQNNRGIAVIDITDLNTQWVDHRW